MPLLDLGNTFLALRVLLREREAVVIPNCSMLNAADRLLGRGLVVHLAIGEVEEGGFGEAICNIPVQGRRLSPVNG